MCAKDEFVDLHLQIETSRLWLEKGTKDEDTKGGQFAQNEIIICTKIRIRVCLQI